MPNVTPPNSASAPGQWLGTPVRGTLKGALATLVLLLLAMLFWLLIEQFRETLAHKRQYSINYSADLADHISLSMALRAEVALNLLPAHAPLANRQQLQALVHQMRQSLPSLAVPSLWLAGRRDRLVNPQAMQAAAAQAPGARYLAIEHAGHAPFLTHADAVAEALLDFLAGARA